MAENTEDKVTYRRLEGETDIAWQGFQMYLEQGLGRTMTNVAKSLNKSTTVTNRWAKKYRWKERAALYQREIDEWAISRDLTDRKSARLRQLRIARKIQELSSDQLEKHEKMAKEINSPQVDMDKATKIAAEGVKLERLIQGDPTEISEQKGSGIDWSLLEPEEIKIFKQILIKAKGVKEDE